MVDFKKRLGSKSIEKKINPIEIYDSLDRRSETGPLRPAQEHILKEWYNERKDRNNLIIKLHTGQGKTLIGLLILHSKLNSKNSPCLYVCPNIYLAKQTVQEAKKFGIPHCSLIDEKEIPDEFLNGDKILITYVQKVFNGKSVFGLNNNSINVNSIILDDSHACIDSIKSSFTINIKKEESIYTKMLTLFYEDLENQGEGSLLDIKEGKFETILAIPYWSWINKKTEVLKLLAENEDQNKSILFTWSILKNNIVNYKAIISGSQIEITPYYIPMFHFGSFANAKHRVLMSATTQDDSFFIKGLQFDLQTINEPLINTEQKWSGEKMLIIPSLIDELLIREEIVNKYAKPEIKKYGIVSLVPNTKFTLQYSEYRATIASATNIFELIQSLKNGKFEKNSRHY
ncbi:DEAD/DEAH box helicase family protein [Rhizosphaericola mali]|uniref:DEAD/DEAH box helicase family protein n=1 Tax=Rhizosphaericola mali TaxID=2545455 RepID=UPI001CD927A7|nr:DEAD/DEAH box helicase family protein [Rhizosphaericola mali]